MAHNKSMITSSEISQLLWWTRVSRIFFTSRSGVLILYKEDFSNQIKKKAMIITVIITNYIIWSIVLFNFPFFILSVETAGWLAAWACFLKYSRLCGIRLLTKHINTFAEVINAKLCPTPVCIGYPSFHNIRYQYIHVKQVMVLKSMWCWPLPYAMRLVRWPANIDAAVGTTHRV